MGVTNFYYNLREVSKRFELPVGKYCVIPSTFNSGEEGEFLIKVFVERSWGSSDQSDPMHFRLSSMSLNTAHGSVDPSPAPSPTISPKTSPLPSPRLRQRCATAAGPNLHVPSDTQIPAMPRRRQIKSLNFSQSFDEEWEVFNRVLDFMKKNKRVLDFMKKNERVLDVMNGNCPIIQIKEED